MSCVLLVDDDAMIRAAMAKVLQDVGYSVVVAAEGREAIACLERQALDLLVLDLDLPIISGWDILDLVRERRPLLPVLVLTGFSGECEPGSLAGADAVLEKPPEVTRFVSLIAELLAETPAKRVERRYRFTAGVATASARSLAPVGFDT